MRQVSGDFRLCVSNEVATYRAANIPRRHLCATVRDLLLSFAGDTCDAWGIVALLADVRYICISAQ